MRTGTQANLQNQTANENNTQIPEHQAPRPLVNHAFSAIIAVSNSPQAVQGYLVPEGASVRVRANNGTVAGNAHIVFVGTYQAQLLNGGGIPLSNLDVINFPVKNLAQIWISGAAGDGVIVSVTT